MRAIRGSWVALAAIIAVGCVPTPANLLTSPPAGSATPIATATPGPTPSGPTPDPSFTRPTPNPSPDFVAYTVRRGDTLEGIADRFGTTGRSIAYWNRVTYPSLDPDSPTYQPDRIERGWVLLLIPGHEVDPEDLPTLSPSPSPTPSPTTKPTATPSPTP